MISAIKVLCVLLGIAGIVVISAIALYIFFIWIYEALSGK